MSIHINGISNSKINQLSKICIKENEWKHISSPDFVILCSNFIAWVFVSPSELLQYTAAFCILRWFQLLLTINNHAVRLSYCKLKYVLPSQLAPANTRNWTGCQHKPFVLLKSYLCPTLCSEVASGPFAGPMRRTTVTWCNSHSTSQPQQHLWHECLSRYGHGQMRIINVAYDSLNVKLIFSHTCKYLRG